MSAGSSFDFKGNALIAGSAIGPVLSGLQARAQAKTAARWALVSAEAKIGEYYAAANRAAARGAVSLYASGFSGGEGLATIIAEEQAAAEEDALVARWNARVQSDALKQQGRNAAVAGVLRGGFEVFKGLATGGLG